MKLLPLSIVGVALGVSAAFAAPTATIVSFEQAADLTATVAYTLADGPAVVTLGAVDAEGNPIPDAALSCVLGDVNREIPAGSAVRTIVWDPVHSAARLGVDPRSVRPVLTVWPLSDTPDYMVVDLASNSTQRVRYYASTNAMPGGLLGNAAYRTTMLVLRKIPAKGVTWTKGSEGEDGRNPEAASGTDPEKKHSVTFDDNYYMGVFEVTQGQWALIKGSVSAAKFSCATNRWGRPMDNVTYCMIRESAANSEDAAYQYPNGPHPQSFLGILNGRTGLSFDLPSDAEWEYACRATTGDNLWNNGKAYSKSYNSNFPGRCSANQADASVKGSSSDAVLAATGPESGTAIVGSYEPNAWGLYDMHGNVWEFCLDWYKADVTANAGAVNVADGVNHSKGKMRVRRGSAWNLSAMQYFRSACRYYDPSKSQNSGNGFRVKLGSAISE